MTIASPTFERSALDVTRASHPSRAIKLNSVDAAEGGVPPNNTPEGGEPMSGPPPKRSEQRVRRNKPDVPIEKLVTDGKPVSAPRAVDGWHYLCIELWDAMKESAQARYYEPSDWQFAKIQLHLLSQQLQAGRASAQMVATINTALTNLLLTEGDRRRVRLEIQRQEAQADVVDIAEELRKRNTGG